MVMSGKMSLGMLVAFLAYRDQFPMRVRNLIDTGFQLQMLGLQLTRLADVVMAEPEQELGRAAKAPAISSITFLGAALRAESVCFRYGESEPWVFRNISIDIAPGSSVAITGPSGCGKTTFIKILMGLIRPTEGTISWNGTNISALGAAAYRERIAGVLQDDGLFAGSLAENICGFDNHPDMERMTECADRAAILDDIRQMPMGFETLVGDMGSTLSGGQKQRVILARALYRRPSILFLDEATSHLDEETEAVVAQALRGLQITRVIVAHRPATIAHADIRIKLESFEKSRVPGVARTGGEATQPLRLPGIARTGREATQSVGIGPPRPSNETRDSRTETAAVDAEVPRAVNIQARERSLAEEATQRSSRVWKLKTSALALAGVAAIGGVPTQVEPPSDETIAASSSAGAPLMQGSAESMHVEVANSERQLVDLTAQASLGHTPVPASAPAAFGAAQPAVGVFGATPVVALESQPQSGSTPPPSSAPPASDPASDGRPPATALNPPEGASAAAVPVETPPPPATASALPTAPNQPSSAPPASDPASDGRPPATATTELASSETCKSGRDRLARLRGNPSAEEVQHFENELSCEILRPQFLRLKESVGLAVPAPSAPASALPTAPNQPSSAPPASHPASDGRPPATALNPPE